MAVPEILPCALCFHFDALRKTRFIPWACNRTCLANPPKHHSTFRRVVWVCKIGELTPLSRRNAFVLRKLGSGALKSLCALFGFPIFSKNKRKTKRKKKRKNGVHFFVSSSPSHAVSSWRRSLCNLGYGGQALHLRVPNRRLPKAVGCHRALNSHSGCPSGHPQK